MINCFGFSKLIIPAVFYRNSKFSKKREIKKTLPEKRKIPLLLLLLQYGEKFGKNADRFPATIVMASKDQFGRRNLSRGFPPFVSPELFFLRRTGA